MFKFIKTGLSKVSKALTKTAAFFSTRLTNIFSAPMDEESLEMLEEILYEADLGSSVVEDFIMEIRSFTKKNPHEGKEKYLKKLEDIAFLILDKKIERKNHPTPLGAKIILLVGVNGSGKTTTIAKLGKIYKDEGKKVLFACGDTFRAAAAEQLEIHAKKLDIDIVLAKHGADPGAVIYDAIEKAKNGYDIVICDTAGRLESKTELLEELKKIDSVIKKQDPGGPHETYLTVDAGLGQTCIDQVEKFQSFINLTGIILTKIDSTAKGGIALSIYKKHHIPISYVGCGEKVCDLSPFDAKSYARALFEG